MPLGAGVALPPRGEGVTLYPFLVRGVSFPAHPGSLARRRASRWSESLLRARFRRPSPYAPSATVYLSSTILHIVIGPAAICLFTSTLPSFFRRITALRVPARTSAATASRGLAAMCMLLLPSCAASFPRAGVRSASALSSRARLCPLVMVPPRVALSASLLLPTLLVLAAFC